MRAKNGQFEAIDVIRFEILLVCLPNIQLTIVLFELTILSFHALHFSPQSHQGLLEKKGLVERNYAEVAARIFIPGQCTTMSGSWWYRTIIYSLHSEMYDVKRVVKLFKL